MISKFTVSVSKKYSNIKPWCSSSGLVLRSALDTEPRQGAKVAAGVDGKSALDSVVDVMYYLFTHTAMSANKIDLARNRYAKSIHQVSEYYYTNLR